MMTDDCLEDVISLSGNICLKKSDKSIIDTYIMFLQFNHSFVNEKEAFN